MNNWTYTGEFAIPDFGIDRRRCHKCIVVGNYMYFVCAPTYDGWNTVNEKKIYKVNVNDGSDITEIYSESCYRLSIMGLFSENALHIIKSSDSNSNSLKSIILYLDGESLPIEGINGLGTWDYTNTTDNPYWTNNLQKGTLISHIRDDSTAVIGLTDMYLGTKYNLLSPVTKTAADTMKVIYTLTDATEEP